MFKSYIAGTQFLHRVHIYIYIYTHMWHGVYSILTYLDCIVIYENMSIIWTICLPHICATNSPTLSRCSCLLLANDWSNLNLLQYTTPNHLEKDLQITTGITYLPHEAVAEVSKDKEPIGRGRAEFNWFESQLLSAPNDMRFKWFGCQSMCASNDFGCLLTWTSNDVVVSWCEIQVIRHCNWSEIQVVWLSIDLRFKWFCMVCAR